MPDDLQFHRTHKVPAIVIDRSDLGLKIDATLTRHNIMVANALIPRSVFEDALAVHVDPRFLEAKDARGGEVDARVVEVVPDRDLM